AAGDGVRAGHVRQPRALGPARFDRCGSARTGDAALASPRTGRPRAVDRASSPRRADIRAVHQLPGTGTPDGVVPVTKTAFLDLLDPPSVSRARRSPRRSRDSPSDRISGTAAASLS